MGLGIVGLLILILDIVALVDVLGSSKSTENKILWVVVIILLPLIGMVLYYLVGRNS